MLVGLTNFQCSAKIVRKSDGYSYRKAARNSFCRVNYGNKKSLSIRVAKATVFRMNPRDKGKILLFCYRPSPLSHFSGQSQNRLLRSFRQSISTDDNPREEVPKCVR